MKISLIAAIVLAAGVRAASGQADIEHIRRGVEAGLDAGRHTGIVTPVAVAWGSAAALAFADDSKLNNNHLVTALVLNTAISAGATWLSNLVLPPRPSGEQREYLARQPTLFVNSWQRGFKETSQKRRFTASAVAVLSGVGVSYLVYSRRD
jgi:hypothetical protein